MRNLGPASARLLAEIGIRDERSLRALGAAEAFRRLRFESPAPPSLNLLWAMQGAIDGRDWRSLTAEEKARLKRAAGL